MNNIKHLVLKQRVVTLPSGYDSFTEHGNIFEYNGKIVFSTTCKKYVTIDGKKKPHYSAHYWTDWIYRGELKVARQSEDNSLVFYDGKFHLFFEDKDAEREHKRYILNHYVADNLSDEFQPVWNGGYTPEDTGIDGCLAVYSPIADLMPTFISDYRTMAEVPHEENIGITEWDGSKFGKLTPILKAKDYGFDSLGVAESLLKVNGRWYLTIAGLIDYYTGNGKWVTGLASCDTLTGKWKLENKAFTNEKGQLIYVNFFKQNGQIKALASIAHSTEMYLADIITDGTSTGDNMLNLKVTDLGNNEVLLEWNHPENKRVYFEDDFGHFLTRGANAGGRYKFTNERNATKFRARPHNIDEFGEWVELNATPPVVVRGCTDPKATNYNPNATEDDGSCEYAPTGDFDKAKALNLVEQLRAEIEKA